MPISTISLDVDQPTFENWSLALAKALGSTFEIRSPIGTSGFFVGMDLPTRENILAGLTDLREPHVPFVTPEAARHRDDRRLSSYSVSQDGTVLELWFEGEIVNQIMQQ